MEVITNNNFESVINTTKPVLIDFWAVWCGPCRILSPAVDEVAEEFAGRAVVAKCNVDDADDVAVSCRVRNIPTMVFFKNGQLVDRLVGLVSKSEIVSKLESLV